MPEKLLLLQIHSYRPGLSQQKTVSATETSSRLIATGVRGWGEGVEIASSPSLGEEEDEMQTIWPRKIALQASRSFFAQRSIWRWEVVKHEDEESRESQVGGAGAAYTTPSTRAAVAACASCF